MTNHRFLFASVDSSPKVGGVSLLAKRVSKALTDNYGAESVYLGPKGTYFLGDELPLKVYEDHQSETKLRAGEHSQAEDERIKNLALAIIDNYLLDMVVLWHPFYYGPGLIAAAKERNIPTAVYVHGTELTSQIPDAKNGPVKFEYNPKSTDLDQRLYSTIDQADVILTNSSYTAQLIENVVPHKKAFVVGCGIDASIFERERDRQPSYSRVLKLMAREDLGLPERKTLIHTGRLVPHKNQKRSIELMRYLTEAQLVIVGDGPDRGALEALSEELGLTDRVFFLGQIDDEEKWNYLRASDAGLLISNFNEKTGGFEGFGITMIEYTAAACAVISSGEYGMSDFAKKYECAFLALKDSEKLEADAKKIKKFLENETDLTEHIEKTRQISSRRFVWTEVARRIMRALDNV